jgi:hypothetical protein
VILKNGKITGVFENSPNKYQSHTREKKIYSEEKNEERWSIRRIPSQIDDVI